MIKMKIVIYVTNKKCYNLDFFKFSKYKKYKLTNYSNYKNYFFCLLYYTRYNQKNYIQV